MPEVEAKQAGVAALTVELLSAYLANNSVPSEELANLIRSTRSALTEELAPAAVEDPATRFTPAVSARKSIASPDHILSLIDGKPYQTLKRHLARHGLTPDSYRERFNLPSSYPMVAPSFAAKRRAIAEKIGLGRKKKDEVPSEENKPLTGGDVPMSGADEIASEAPAKAVTASVPASNPAKAPKAARAKKAQVSTAETTPVSAVTTHAATEEVAPAEVKPDRKSRARRGKLSLFGNIATEDTSVPSPSEASDAGVSAAAEAAAPVKQPKSRRMARPTKPATATAAKVDDKS